MPEPIPNPADGGCLGWVATHDGAEPVPVRVHQWLDGRPLRPEAVDASIARWAGEVLATLHRLAVRPADRSLFPVTSTIVMTVDGPRLCDWDVASPLVPRREVADVAMSLAEWRRFDIANEVVHAYRSSGGDASGLGPTDLGQSMMIGLDWLAFNIERAIGVRPAAPDEAALGDRLVPELLAKLPGQVAVALRLDEIVAG